MPTIIDLPILFVTGLPGSGKTEFLNIARSMPLLCIEWSQVIGETLDSHRCAQSREVALKVIEDFVKEKGAAYFPERILLFIAKAVAHSPTKCLGVVVSGARNPEELRILASSFARSLVVILCADYLTRYQRSKKRGRTRDPVDLEGFVRNDFAELHTGIAAIADDMPQALIFNDAKLSEFTDQVKELLRSYFYVDNPSQDH